MLSLATNACAADDVRIRHTVPSWLRVFGDRLSELLIVVDEQPPTGRIAALQGQHAGLDRLYAELDKLVALDPRVRVVVLDTRGAAERTLAKWFGAARPLRCQAGTPIYAFIQAIEEAKGPIVLRCDCDMLFHDAGWVARAEALLTTGAADIVEPGRVGVDASREALAMSTRAFVVNTKRLGARLPIPAHRLDPARQIQRFLKGRPPWLALEQMIEKERRAGRLRHVVLDGKLGFALHVTTRQQAGLPWFERVVPLVERGELPKAQLDHGPNFAPEAWAPIVGG